MVLIFLRFRCCCFFFLIRPRGLNWCIGIAELVVTLLSLLLMLLLSNPTHRQRTFRIILYTIFFFLIISPAVFFPLGLFFFLTCLRCSFEGDVGDDTMLDDDYCDALWAQRMRGIPNSPREEFKKCKYTYMTRRRLKKKGSSSFVHLRGDARKLLRGSLNKESHFANYYSILGQKRFVAEILCKIWLLGCSKSLARGIYWSNLSKKCNDKKGVKFLKF